VNSGAMLHYRTVIFFEKKINLKWIKFTHIVISILFLIIFYLILLLKKSWKL
jgi:hypothetical protein